MHSGSQIARLVFPPISERKANHVLFEVVIWTSELQGSQISIPLLLSFPGEEASKTAKSVPCIQWREDFAGKQSSSNCNQELVTLSQQCRSTATAKRRDGFVHVRSSLCCFLSSVAVVAHMHTLQRGELSTTIPTTYRMRLDFWIWSALVNRDLAVTSAFEVAVAQSLDGGRIHFVTHVSLSLSLASHFVHLGARLACPHLVGFVILG